MSPAVAIAVGALAAGFGLTVGLLAWAVRGWRRERQLAARVGRAKARARLPEEMFLLRRDDLGPDHDWAHRLLTDIHQLPTTTHERGNQ